MSLLTKRLLIVWIGLSIGILIGTYFSTPMDWKLATDEIFWVGSTCLWIRIILNDVFKKITDENN